jgi:glycerol-3-phosphate acyltransferase PlsY
MLINVALIVGAYLLGSLPVIYWIGRMRGFDLRQEYDMHLALWRKVGFLEGLVGILWEILKGVAPPLAARLLSLDILIVALSGLAAVLGQMWPIFIRFNKGEKGNSTGLAASLVISPPVLGVALIPVAIGAFIKIASSMRESGKTASQRFKFSGVSNSMPLGMATGFAILPLAAWGFHQPSAVIGTFVLLFTLIMVRRLTAGLGKDLETDPRPNLASLLKNRFLYDRSYR